MGRAPQGRKTRAEKSISVGPPRQNRHLGDAHVVSASEARAARTLAAHVTLGKQRRRYETRGFSRVSASSEIVGIGTEVEKLI